MALGPTGARLALVEAGATTREVGVRFVDSQPARVMTGTEALPGRTHYYRGNDPRAWTTNVTTFGRVRATGIYPGVDLEYYGRDRQLDRPVVRVGEPVLAGQPQVGVVEPVEPQPSRGRLVERVLLAGLDAPPPDVGDDLELSRPVLAHRPGGSLR